MNQLPISAPRRAALVLERFLDLLVAEATDEEFDRLLAEALAGACTATERAAIRRAGAQAMRLLGTFRGLRRREQELVALNDSARDLSTHHDTEGVLQAIVRRARQLLGSDLAYITLIDAAAAETYMRVSEGELTARFASIRLKLGAGIGGVVAESKMPITSRNIRTDERIIHDAELASAVAEEGLVAVLGVPLLINEAVIGVLYAADRRERPFAQHEIALLSSLAAHAAITLENARLLEQSENSRTALQTSSDREHAHNQALERIAEARERLARVALEGGTLVNVLTELARLTEASLIAVDADGAVLASAGSVTTEIHRAAQRSGSVFRDVPHKRELRSGLAQSQRRGKTVKLAVRDEGIEYWATPLVARAEPIGCILSVRCTPLDKSDVSILENGALVCGLVLVNERAVAEAEQRLRGELLSDLMLAPERQQAARHRARLLGYELDRPHAVVVVDVDSLDGRRAAASRVAREHDGFMGEHLGRVVFVLPHLTPEEAASTVHEKVRSAASGHLTVGAAGPADTPSQIAERFREADSCLRALLTLNRPGEWATAEQLGVFGVLVDGMSEQRVNRLVESYLQHLIDYDSTHASSLLDTLSAFFENSGHLAATSRALHIHINTLYQRLERISMLLGADWQKSDRALEFHLAVRLARLRGGVTAQARQ